MSLSTVTICHNLERIRYPAIPWTLDSVQGIADEIIIVDAGPHSDNTSELVLMYKSDHKNVKVVKAEWPTHWRGLADITNAGMEAATSDWIWTLQGDEFCLGSDFEVLRWIQNLPKSVKACEVDFRHFIGDMFHTFPFDYQKMVRLCRNKSGWISDNDAGYLSGPGGAVRVPITVFHVGKIHTGREQAAAEKEYRFQKDLYEGKGICEVDPRVTEVYEGNKQMDYYKIFDGKRDVSDYNGPWPEDMIKWQKHLYTL
jgi:glycosyltransferase involved in cell wall biosynthesis